MAGAGNNLAREAPGRERALAMRANIVYGVKLPIYVGEKNFQSGDFDFHFLARLKSYDSDVKILRHIDPRRTELLVKVFTCF